MNEKQDGARAKGSRVDGARAKPSRVTDVAIFDYTRMVRNAIRNKLGRQFPWIMHSDGTNMTMYVFTGKDMSAVRDVRFPRVQFFQDVTVFYGCPHKMSISWMMDKVLGVPTPDLMCKVWHLWNGKHDQVKVWKDERTSRKYRVKILDKEVVGCKTLTEVVEYLEGMGYVLK